MIKNKYIFIVSVGRSGSTLLQNLLNAHDNVLIRGENNNFFYYAMLAYQSLLNDEIKGSKNVSKELHPWYGYNYYDQDTFREHIYELGKKYFLGNQDNDLFEFLGFKEIRYFDLIESQQSLSVCKIKISNEKVLNPRSQLKELLSFLNITFKPSIFILLTRDENEIVKSKWWNNPDSYDKDILKKDIKLFYDEIINISKEKNLQLINIDYKLLKEKDHKKINEQFFSKLGIKYDKTKAAKILLTEYSKKYKFEIKDSREA